MSEPEPGFPLQRLAVCVALAASMGFLACVVSIDPIVPEADAIFDPDLLGVWRDVDGDDRVVVTQAGENLYEIEYTSEFEPHLYHARLGELGARRILDVWPVLDDGPVRGRDPLRVAGHLLVDLETVGPDRVVTRLVEPGAARPALESGELALDYTDAEGLVLHGRTAALRAALRPFLDRPGAFAGPTEWRRVAPEATRPGNP
jgi:hypothetical protein